MFTGIIETQGIVDSIQKNGKNLDLTILSSISDKLSVDQSVSHDGVCLTITSKNSTSHQVTLVNETIKKSNFSRIKKGSKINLERCMKINDLIDGHIVQGHVDEVAECVNIKNEKNSWELVFSIDKKSSKYLVEKGSVCINGTSLTCFNVGENNFSVVIIPHTYNKTNFKSLKEGDIVNIEYDIIGKYIEKMIKN